jgi:hypothetical protein
MVYFRSKVKHEKSPNDSISEATGFRALNFFFIFIIFFNEKFHACMVHMEWNGLERHFTTKYDNMHGIHTSGMK